MTSCTIRHWLKLLPLLLVSCTHKPQLPAVNDNFPPEISRIVINRCATAGCHNALSYRNAGDLLLDSWEHLFEGGASGSVVVPYSVDNSSLLYFINKDTTLGPVAEPLMPLNGTALSPEDYRLMRDWIAAGAPDRNGRIAFSSEPDSRQKIYLVHQACDALGVIDGATGLVMRYLPLGQKPYPESLTSVQVSPDGRYAYTCFWYHNEVYQIDTRTDRVLRSFSLNNNFWSRIVISPDGNQLALTNGDDNSLALIHIPDGKISYPAGKGMVNCLGIAANKGFDTFYITSQYGNTLYKFHAGTVQQISLDGNAPSTAVGGNTPDPNDVLLTPDGSRYFVCCEKSGEIRMFDSSKDVLQQVIKVGKSPGGLTMSLSRPYLFVACAEEENGGGKFKGVVYVINYQTGAVVSRIAGPFFQPHSIAVNERDNTFYVFNRNQNYQGPAPHHKGPCSGRNGYYNIYDLNTLQLRTNKRCEVLVDPYGAAARFGL